MSPLAWALLITVYLLIALVLMIEVAKRTGGRRR
jgi:hypothetical protein